jgi:hypothetical protein
MVKIENPKIKNNIRGIDVEFFSFKNDERKEINLIISRSEMPIKGDEILIENLDGTHSVDIANKNLSNKDVYVESTRMVFKVILKDEEIPENIKNDYEVQNKKLFIECQSNRDIKSPNANVFEVDKMAFEIKKPIQIHVF